MKLESPLMCGNQTIFMIMFCPMCGARHIDEGEFENKPHHTHACQNCGNVWRPALENTHGVRFLPGFKNAANPQPEERRDEMKEVEERTAYHNIVNRIREYLEASGRSLEDLIEELQSDI